MQLCIVLRLRDQHRLLCKSRLYNVDLPIFVDAVKYISGSAINIRIVIDKTINVFKKRNEDHGYDART